MTAYVPGLAETDLKKIVLAVQQLAAGRSNAVGSVTLATGAATTTVSTPNCAAGSTPILTPASANAAAEAGNGTIYVSAVESAAATILIDSEIGKVCIITACGGRGIKRWLPLIGEIENYAGQEGCKRVRIFGRKGWLRVLDGYQQKYVIMDKELR